MGAKRYCRKLMKEDLLGFVGSDSHNTKTRIPNIGAGAAYVSKKWERHMPKGFSTIIRWKS